MIAQPIRAVLFDLDETLMNRRLALNAFIEHLIRDYGGSFEMQDAEHIRSTFIAADGGGYRAKREVYEDLVTLLGWRSPPSADQYMAYWNRVYPTCATPEKGLRETLRFFRNHGLKLGLITNGQTKVQQAKVDLLGIRGAFGSIVVSEQAGCKKPDPAIFQIALEELNVRPFEAWYVGDHPRNDVFGARNAGLFVVWKQGIHEWDEALPIRPHAAITELRELESIYLDKAGIKASF